MNVLAGDTLPWSGGASPDPLLYLGEGGVDEQKISEGQCAAADTARTASRLLPSISLDSIRKGSSVLEASTGNFASQKQCEAPLTVEKGSVTVNSSARSSEASSHGGVARSHPITASLIEEEF